MHSQIYSGLSLMWIFHDFPIKLVLKEEITLNKEKKRNIIE